MRSKIACERRILKTAGENVYHIYNSDAVGNTVIKVIRLIDWARFNVPLDTF